MIRSQRFIATWTPIALGLLWVISIAFITKSWESILSVMAVAVIAVFCAVWFESALRDQEKKYSESMDELLGEFQMTDCNLMQRRLSNLFKKYASKIHGSACFIALATDEIMDGHVLASPEEIDMLRKLYPNLNIPETYVKCPCCMKHFIELQKKYDNGSSGLEKLLSEAGSSIER